MATVNGFSVFNFPGTFEQTTVVLHAFIGQRSTLTSDLVPGRVLNPASGFEVSVEARATVLEDPSLSLESLMMLQQGMIDAALGSVQPVPVDVFLHAAEAE